jgi:hypothetical protein
LRGVEWQDFGKHWYGRWQMNNQLSDREILLEVIKTEKEALEKDGEAGFYPKRHYVIEKLQTKADGLLDENELEDLYFCFLRLRVLPRNIKRYDIIERSYTRLLPYFEKGYPYTSLNRLTGLLLFGYSDKDEVDHNNGYQDYDLFVKLLFKTESYTSIPGVLQGVKKQRLSEFARNDRICGRICKSLLSIGFIHGNPDSDYQRWIHQPSFWCLICILLLNGGKEAGDTLDIFRKSEKLPRFAEHMETLKRCEDAVGIIGSAS